MGSQPGLSRRRRAQRARSTSGAIRRRCAPLLGLARGRWVLIALVIAGAFWLYRRQPPMRRAAIKTTAADAARWFLSESERAARSAQQSREQLAGHLVPRAERATPAAAVLRELATAPESMSAQQLYDVLDAPVRAPVSSLRQFLHANAPSIFREGRRGSFLLGGRCVIR
jgi:hypothetical protein